MLEGLLAPLRVVLQRSLADWLIVVTTWLVIVCATTLLAIGVLYGDGVKASPPWSPHTIPLCSTWPTASWRSTMAASQRRHRFPPSEGLRARMCTGCTYLRIQVGLARNHLDFDRNMRRAQSLNRSQRLLGRSVHPTQARWAGDTCVS